MTYLLTGRHISTTGAALWRHGWVGNSLNTKIGRSGGQRRFLYQGSWRVRQSGESMWITEIRLELSRTNMLPSKQATYNLCVCPGSCSLQQRKSKQGLWNQQRSCVLHHSVRFFVFKLCSPNPKQPMALHKQTQEKNAQNLHLPRIAWVVLMRFGMSVPNLSSVQDIRIVLWVALATHPLAFGNLQNRLPNAPARNWYGDVPRMLHPFPDPSWIVCDAAFHGARPLVLWLDLISLWTLLMLWLKCIYCMM